MAASDQPPAALVRPEALESAVHSARNLVWYSNAEISEVVAHLTLHIALAHPWVDGNKRTSAAAGIMTARLNGARQSTQEEAMEFAQHLIRVIEQPDQSRDNAFAEFVAFVEQWFKQ
ncbi:MAG: type II toxin-antitoxin system death-on-curing family toxin [Thermomicrobiales bacterium]|nr:type II toxin-antitoxin system death-on-curing family toxin [Thermomicrobiales bacterium]